MHLAEEADLRLLTEAEARQVEQVDTDQAHLVEVVLLLIQVDRHRLEADLALTLVEAQVEVQADLIVEDLLLQEVVDLLEVHPDLTAVDHHRLDQAEGLTAEDLLLEAVVLQEAHQGLIVEDLHQDRLVRAQDQAVQVQDLVGLVQGRADQAQDHQEDQDQVEDLHQDLEEEDKSTH